MQALANRVELQLHKLGGLSASRHVETEYSTAFRRKQASNSKSKEQFGMASAVSELPDWVRKLAVMLARKRRGYWSFLKKAENENIEMDAKIIAGYY